MKRVLVCGSNGLLGQRLAWLFDSDDEYEVLHSSHHRSFVQSDILIDYTQLDISNRSDVKSLVTSFRPDVILNAAAMTNVDECERGREQAWKANVTAVENLTEVSRRIGAKLIHVSTDYVFDGKTGNYTEDDRVNPVNYYGKTKLAGENVLVSSGINYAVLRTIVVYGNGVNVRNNFCPLGDQQSAREKAGPLCSRSDQQSHACSRSCDGNETMHRSRCKRGLSCRGSRTGQPVRFCRAYR